MGRTATCFVLFFLFLPGLSIPKSLAQSLIRSAYLPTSSTAQNVGIAGVAVDSVGESCISGYGATANNGPFVTKLSAGGSTTYSISTVNGSASNGYGPVAMDAQGNCYVYGYGTIATTTGVFRPTPKPPNGYGMWIAKFDGSGNVVFATYFGGSGRDTNRGIAVDAAGNVYLTGQTQSNDFPTKNAYQNTIASANTSDAYVSVLNPNGAALVYSTYWGGSGDDIGYAIATDASSNAYVAGGTCSSDFPTVAPISLCLQDVQMNSSLN
jgi:hypothetical protein